MKISLVKAVAYSFAKAAICSLVLLGAAALSPVKADDRHNDRHNARHDARVFYSYESNGADYISAIGIGVTHKYRGSNLGFQLNTSLGYAEVLAQDGFLEEYTSWEASVRFGYFSKISFFAEFGIDLGEAIFDDYRYDRDDYCYYDEYCYQDDIDGYLGFGAGIKAGHVSIEGIIRAREIDSHYWEAESEIFSGLQVSLNF